jgi:hypothetical protein
MLLAGFVYSFVFFIVDFYKKVNPTGKAPLGSQV